jgi:hypothetical protein
MASIDEDLNQLEKDIRQLKIEFEAYFGGGRKRPPTEIQWRIEQTIKRHGEKGAQLNYGQRFKLNNLTSTYAKYADVFRKRMKAKEEGTVQRHYGAAAREIEAERARSKPAAPPPPPEPEPPPRRAAAAGKAGEVVVAYSDPSKEGDKVKQLYEALLEAKKKAGEKTDNLTLDSFSKFVSSKADQLKSQKGSKEVEFAVSTEGGQVKLKARVR